MSCQYFALPDGNQTYLFVGVCGGGGGGGAVGGGKRHAVGDLIYFFVYYGKLLLKGPKIVQVREEKKSPECPILSRDQSYL